MPSIAVLQDPEHDALHLAKTLGLPLSPQAFGFDYLLIWEKNHLSLCHVGDKSQPLSVDFTSKSLQYRSQRASLKGESLARALGLKDKQPSKIIDATAGLGRDSFILASLGFDLTLLERNPIVHALLADGIQRGLKDPKLAPIMQRMRLIQGSALDYLKHSQKTPEIIYLDPMFPERQKTAMVKKEMRFLQDIVLEEDDSPALLELALTCATKRVVVKRPRLAPCLAGPPPSFTREGSSCRFDIYLRG